MILKLLSSIHHINILNFIPLFGLFIYNISQLKNILRVRDLFFLFLFFSLHAISIGNLNDFHLNVLCIEFIFIIFWFKFPGKTDFSHFIILFFFSILLIFLDNVYILNFLHLSSRYKIETFNYLIKYNAIIYIFHLLFFQKKIFTSSNFYLKVFLLYFLIIFSNITQILFSHQELSKYIIFSIFLYTFYIYLLYKKYINYTNLKFLNNKIYIYIILLIIFLNYQIVIFFEKGYSIKLNDFFIINFLILFKINFKKNNTIFNTNTKINYLSFFMLNLNLIISHFYVFFLSLKLRSPILNCSSIGIILFSIYCIIKYINIFRKNHKELLKNNNIENKKHNIDFLAILLFILNIILFCSINKDLIHKTDFSNLHLLNFDKRILIFAFSIIFLYKSKEYLYKIGSFFIKVGNFTLRATKITLFAFYISCIEYIFLLKIKFNKISKTTINMNLENRILNINNVILILMLLVLGLIVLNFIFN